MAAKTVADGVADRNPLYNRTPGPSKNRLPKMNAERGCAPGPAARHSRRHHRYPLSKTCACRPEVPGDTAIIPSVTEGGLIVKGVLSKWRAFFVNGRWT